MSRSDSPGRPDDAPAAPRAVRAAGEVRSEYTSARLIAANIEHRLGRTVMPRPAGYVAPEIDYVLHDGTTHTISVRDSDIRHLDRVPEVKAVEQVDLIHRARRGDRVAADELEQQARRLWRSFAARFGGPLPVENACVIPYTSAGEFTEGRVSHKGYVLLDLWRRGFATADFNLLSADAYRLSGDDLDRAIHDAVGNLEMLTGRRLGDPANPLLIAVRSAVSEYIPGFMPTYLNVGLTPGILPGLPARYGLDGAARIHLNNRKTILEALDPEAYAEIEGDLRPGLSRAEAEAQSCRLEALIAARSPDLLTDAFGQLRFFVGDAYRYYRAHLGVLQSFMRRQTHFPAVILQRMVCSVIDDRSYAGLLYSRHPRLGSGVFLQYAKAIFGEDLMTGRLVPEERHFADREEAREKFPAVYHFWNRLFQLEEIFRGPVMVEFTGVHGTFTILQVDAAELSGAGMLTAVMDLHRSGGIPPERVRELIKPYHVRQIESDAIDPGSLGSLEPFSRGVAVLPRSAVTGRLSFSVGGEEPSAASDLSRVILAKERFTPQDAMAMQRVRGICSLSPAAIHVVTTAQNLGIPALLNLEEDGVRIDLKRRCLVNGSGKELKEGDWVTISSRRGLLYAGRAVFAPARLLRFMDGEPVELSPTERPRFERLAADYREYRRIVESVDASGFESLQDLGHAIRYGELRDDPARAQGFVNRCFDARPEELVHRLLETTLGMHLANLTAFSLLTTDRQVRLFRLAAAECGRRGLSGYHAGAFVIGSLLAPRPPVAFWERFRPDEVAFLLNEWVRHQKYLAVLESIGEKRIARAREIILSGELSDLPRLAALAIDFVPLKLSGVNLDDVRRSVAADADPETVDLVDLLCQPYRAFFEYGDPASVGRLRQLCETEGLRVPGPDER